MEKTLMNAIGFRPKSNKIIVFTLFFMFVVILFFNGTELSYQNLYLNISKTNILIPFLFIGLTLTILSSHKKIFDFICLILFLRLGIYLFPLFYTHNVNGYLGNYFSILASFFIYFILIQKNKNDISKIINKIMVLVLIIGSIQVINLYIKIYENFGSLDVNIVKYYMVTPIGASNYISCVLLPIMVFIYNSKIKNSVKYIALGFGLLSLLLIQSKNAIIILMIFILFKVFKMYIKQIYIMKNEGIHSYQMVIIGSLVFIGMVVTFIAYLINYFLNKWNMGTSFIGSSIYETINALSSNRLIVYENEISRWTEHLFFGNGLGYDEEIYKSHNWIIDLLVHTGVLGTTVYFIALIWWYSKIRPYLKKDKFIKASYYFCIVVLLQGLAEVSLFTISIDLLFWAFIGLSISRISYLEVDTDKKD